MIRIKLVRCLRKYLPDEPPGVVFERANAIYTALVHLSSIAHSMIIQVSALPDVHMNNIIQVLGIPQHIYQSAKHYLDTIKKYPMYRRQSRDMMLISTLGFSIFLIYRALCLLEPHAERKVPEGAPPNMLAMGAANILAMEVYPTYTYYYTVCSMMLMLLKHLFVTFCHLLRTVMALSPACREDVWAILGVHAEMLEKMKDSWLVGRIITESVDDVELV